MGPWTSKKQYPGMGQGWGWDHGAVMAWDWGTGQSPDPHPSCPCCRTGARHKDTHGCASYPSPALSSPHDPSPTHLSCSLTPPPTHPLPHPINLGEHAMLVVVLGAWQTSPGLDRINSFPSLPTLLGWVSRSLPSLTFNRSLKLLKWLSSLNNASILYLRCTFNTCTKFYSKATSRCFCHRINCVRMWSQHN